MKTKILFFLLVQIILTSCASMLEPKYNAINTFLETEIKKDEKSILTKDKLNIKNVFRIFYRGEGNMEIEKQFRSPLFDEKDYEIMLKKYSTDSVYKPWTAADFPKFNLIFENKISLWNTRFLDKYELSPANIYFLSEPIYYRNKEFVLFYYGRGRTSDIDGIQTHQVIIMKKIKGEWKIIERVADYAYY